MKKRINISKRIKYKNDWNVYRSLKNSINSKIKIAHYTPCNYFNRTFDNSFNGNHKQFWYFQSRKLNKHSFDE